MSNIANASAPTELGTLKIGKLLRMYAVPGIIAQTAASLYNMVDSIFIGNIKDVGAYAISGLAVTFPLMNLSIAVGTLVGIGAMTMISVLLGQRDYEKARKVLANTLSLNVIIGILFSVVSLIFLDPILYFFGASENTLPYAREYMQIILIGNVFTHLYFGFNGVLRASGHPKTAMGLTLFTVISNSILDPIFIYVLNMGIKGAALATVICQVLALCYSMRFLMDKNKVLHFPRPLFQLNTHIAKQSMAIGIGPCLMNAAACLVALFINQQLRKYSGDLAIGAFGIANRVTMMFLMVVMGINQGMQPIAGYNFGARQLKRVKEVFWMSAKWALYCTTLCWVMSMLIPDVVVRLFTNDLELQEMASEAMKNINMCIAPVGFCIVTSNFYQCLGMVKKSIFLSLSRQLLFLVPLVYLLPLNFGAKGVWWSFPISDIVAVATSAIFIFFTFKKFDKIKDGEDTSALGSAVK